MIRLFSLNYQKKKSVGGDITKAVIYALYSSHNQREESIEGQLLECHEFALKNGMTVKNEYCARAISHI